MPNGPVFSRREFLISSLMTAAVVFSTSAAWSKEPEERYKIGFIYPGSGEIELEAKSLIAGFDLFFHEKGACPLDVVKKPYGENFDEVAATLDSWINDEKVRFIVVNADIEVSQKIIQKCANAKAIVFVSNRSIKLVAGEICQPNVFRVSANNYVLSEPLAPWAVKNIGSKAFITGDDNQTANEQGDFFAFGFERAGGAFGDRVMLRDSPDSIQSVMASIKNSDAEFVFACCRGELASRFLKTYYLEDPKVRKPIVGPESLTSINKKPDAVSETILNIPVLTNVPDPGSLRSKISSLLGPMELSATCAAEGYDLAQVVGNSVKEDLLQAGDFENLLRFVQDSKIQGFRGDFTFDKNHDAVVDSWVASWEMKSGELSQKVIASLGQTASLDFGCGKVGYPNRPETTPAENGNVWEENAN